LGTATGSSDPSFNRELSRLKRRYGGTFDTKRLLLSFPVGVDEFDNCVWLDAPYSELKTVADLRYFERLLRDNGSEPDEDVP
jgi:hypothetical protein